MADFVVIFSRQISLEINRFCTDQTCIFNVFLTEVIINLLFQQFMDFLLFSFFSLHYHSLPFQDEGEQLCHLLYSLDTKLLGELHF